MRLQALDLDDAGQAADWLDLLDHYAQGPMGGGKALSAAVRADLVPRLRAHPGFHAALLYDGATAVGLINCFTGFSTFAARPLLNIHDIVVRAGWRGQGLAHRLLDWATGQATVLGCCKLTLEVLSNNHGARAAYARAGFAPYVLDPAAGDALFLEKKLQPAA